MCIRKAVLAFTIVSGVLLSGCMNSREAVFTGSEGVSVPDFSGTYRSGENGKDMVVVGKGGNAFEVTQGEYGDPEQAVIVPLKAADSYLLQYSNGKEYMFLVMTAQSDRLVISTFAALVNGGKGADDSLAALLAKHAVTLDKNMTIQGKPSGDALVALFNDCVADPAMLAEIESLTRK